MPLDKIAARHFPHYRREALGRDASLTFLALRLAEEGDRRELRWLVSRLGEGELTRILGRHAGRQLSARSAAFWRLLLEIPDQPASEAARRQEIWPL